MNEQLAARCGHNIAYRDPADTILKKTFVQYAETVRFHGRKRYYVSPTDPELYLTRREAECALLAMGSFTNRDIALYMRASPRTVEFYLKNMRTKLSCYSKDHLTKLLDKMNFTSMIERGNNELFSEELMQDSKHRSIKLAQIGV